MKRPKVLFCFLLAMLLMAPAPVTGANTFEDRAKKWWALIDQGIALLTQGVRGEIFDEALDLVLTDRYLGELRRARKEMSAEVNAASAETFLALQDTITMVDDSLTHLKSGAVSQQDLARMQADISTHTRRLRLSLERTEAEVGLLRSEIQDLKERLEAMEERYVFNPARKSVAIEVLPFVVRPRDAPPGYSMTAAEYLGAELSTDDRIQLAGRDGADLSVTGSIEGLTINERSYRVGRVTSSNVQYILDAVVTSRNARSGRIYLKKTYNIEIVDHVLNLASSRRETQVVKLLDQLAERAGRDLQSFVFWDPSRDRLPIVEEAADADED